MLDTPMSALREVKNCRQIRGELRRRWFSTADEDLIVWYDNGGSPFGFQFCYQDGWTERALTWKPDTGYLHTTVDDGESNHGLRYKGTPILNPDGPINFPHLQKLFSQAVTELPAAIVEFVATHLVEPAQLPKS
jgi:hypothetical protein